MSVQEYLFESFAQPGTSFNRIQAERLLSKIVQSLVFNSLVDPASCVVCITTRPGGDLGFSWYVWLVSEKMAGSLPDGLCDWIIPIAEAHAITRQFQQYVFPKLEQLGIRDSTTDQSSVDGDSQEFHQQPTS